MTKAETIMLVLVVLFGAALALCVMMVKAGSLNSMTFWNGGVMALMAVCGLIAALGLSTRN